MSDKQINQFKSMNINFRDKLREAYLNNKHEFDDQDNRIIQPILNDVLYSNGSSNNNLRESIRKKWDGLSKDINDINNSQFDIPSGNNALVVKDKSGNDQQLNREEKLEGGLNGKYKNGDIQPQNKATTINTNNIKSRIPMIPNDNKSQVRFQQPLNNDEEINQLKKTIESLNNKIKHQIIEKKDIIEEFQTKEIRMMKNNQNEINKLIKKYEIKLKNQQQQQQQDKQTTNDNGGVIIDQLGIQIDKLNNEIDNKNLQIIQLTNQVSNLKDENFNLKRENNRLKHSNESPSKETNPSDNSESQELRKLIDNLTKENIELRSQYNQLKNNSASNSFQYGSVQGDDSDDEEQEDQEEVNGIISRYKEEDDVIDRVAKSNNGLEYDTQRILKKEYGKNPRIPSPSLSPPKLQAKIDDDSTTSKGMGTAANEAKFESELDSVTTDLLKVKKEEEIDTTQQMLRKHWH